MGHGQRDLFCPFGVGRNLATTLRNPRRDPVRSTGKADGTPHRFEDATYVGPSEHATGFTHYHKDQRFWIKKNRTF